ncbi:MAG: substrate-binding periplasmic protein [Desulforhopalus sp.]
MNTPSPRHCYFVIFLFIAAFFAAGCVRTTDDNGIGTFDNKSKPLLRIGTSANAPPFAYQTGGELQGLEIDFGKQLAFFLGKEPRFVNMKWENLIPALEKGEIDIIMAGMTVTPERAYRVNFAKPYMRTGQMLLVRRDEAQRYATGIYSLMGNKPAIGTIENTTGDYFITKTINRPHLTRFKTSKNAVAALIEGKIDVFVHDAPIICYYAAIDENRGITPILQLITEEYLAWAVNKSSGQLLQNVNEFIDASVEGDTLRATTKRWIPFM